MWQAGERAVEDVTAAIDRLTTGTVRSALVVGLGRAASLLAWDERTSRFVAREG